MHEAIAGGDDYELLFAVRPRTRRAAGGRKRHGDAPLTRIGICTRRRGRALPRGTERGSAARRDTISCCAGGLQPISDDSSDARALRRWLDALLHIEDSPERTAAAFALGVFFGFSPLLGLHTLLGILFAFLLNLNRVAVLLGVYIEPAVVPRAVLRIDDHGRGPDTGIGCRSDFGMQLAAVRAVVVPGEFWRQLVVVLRPLVWPFIVGSTLGALVLAMRRISWRWRS